MWKRLAVILVIVCLGLMPGIALASDPTVTITVSVWVVGAPSGLTITYVSDTQVDLEWVKGHNAENTMIRAKYGTYPTGHTDGYQVYYGDGTTASDTGVNFEEGLADVYYAAYSETALGVWEDEGTSGLLENPYMLLAILIFAALAFSITSLIFKKGYLAYPGAAVWVITAVYCFSRSTETWDIYFLLGFLFLFVMLVFVLAPLSWREKTPEEEDVDTLVAGLHDDMKRMEWDNQLNFGSRTRRRRQWRPRLPKMPD